MKECEVIEYPPAHMSSLPAIIAMCDYREEARRIRNALNLREFQKVASG